MHAQPTPEHTWLKKFLGDWSYESEADMGPEGTFKNTGTEKIRGLGDLWVVGEGEGTMGTTLLTLGYEPDRKQFAGTWVGSMMSRVWVYDAGWLDHEHDRLTLECDGPSFSEEGRASGELARYRDVFELKSNDHRVLTASVKGEDGKWTTFMTTHYRRQQ